MAELKYTEKELRDDLKVYEARQVFKGQYLQETGEPTLNLYWLRDEPKSIETSTDCYVAWLEDKLINGAS